MEFALERQAQARVRRATRSALKRAAPVAALLGQGSLKCHPRLADSDWPRGRSPATLAGLRGAPARRPGFEVVWEATGRRARAGSKDDAGSFPTDLLLPDMTRTGRDPRPAGPRCRDARADPLGVPLEARISPRLAAGASGYLLKSAGPEAIFRAIEEARGPPRRPRRGGGTARGACARVRPHPSRARGSSATRRRRTNHDIARALGMSAGTVRTHLSKILLKLGVDDRAAP